MMREEQVRAILKCYFTGFKDELIEGAVTFICAIKEEPKYVCNADGSVEPIEKTGHWIYTGDCFTEGMLKCSSCGYEHDVADRFLYCPKCGTKMESEAEHERSKRKGML